MQATSDAIAAIVRQKGLELGTADERSVLIFASCAFRLTHLPGLSVDVLTAGQVDSARRKWIFDLFESNMRKMSVLSPPVPNALPWSDLSWASYEASSGGWDPSDTRETFWHPDSRFLLVRDDVSNQDVGFVMWRFDWEESAADEDVEVVYWSVRLSTCSSVRRPKCDVFGSYELQLSAKARGKGLGSRLMHVLQSIAKAWSMKKVILTAQKGMPRALVASHTASADL